jgi:hypothetical protein
MQAAWSHVAPALSDSKKGRENRQINAGARVGCAGAPAGGGLVVARRDTVALEGPDLRVDTRLFQQAVDRGDPVGALEACDAPILDGLTRRARTRPRHRPLRTRMRHHRARWGAR